ncbi:MAG TPA: HAMP domain-containing sensor histidine kinase [Nocardioides sp.]|nr:HAMP domain-containing sensor histidine kinase [Nocardioides sp.]
MEDDLPRGALPRTGVVAPADRGDDDFLGVVGRAVHDLRNPLAVIEGWAGELVAVVRDGAVPAPHLAQLAERILGAAEEASSLVDALLADAAVRAREPAIERVDLTVLAHAVVASLPGPAQVQVLEVGVVPGDQVLLRRLLANLLDNALKYVAPGTLPEVTISGKPVEEGVCVSVADRGIGIPPGAHQRIFGDFERATSEKPGTGLGLSICRRIAEQHGGRICARDRDDGHRGAVFELTVPAWNPNAPAHPDLPGPDREGREP